VWKGNASPHPVAPFRPAPIVAPSTLFLHRSAGRNQHQPSFSRWGKNPHANRHYPRYLDARRTTGSSAVFAFGFFVPISVRPFASEVPGGNADPILPPWSPLAIRGLRGHPPFLKLAPPPPGLTPLSTKALTVSSALSMIDATRQASPSKTCVVSPPPHLASSLNPSLPLSYCFPSPGWPLVLSLTIAPSSAPSPPPHDDLRTAPSANQKPRPPLGLASRPIVKSTRKSTPYFPDCWERPCSQKLKKLILTDPLVRKERRGEFDILAGPSIDHPLMLDSPPAFPPIGGANALKATPGSASP